MLANSDAKKYTMYYLESIARGALPIFRVKHAVRERYSDMKQTETEAVEILHQTHEGHEPGLLKLFWCPK